MTDKDGNHGSATNTTAVTVIPAAIVGRRMVTKLRLNNLDTVSRVFTLSVAESGESDVQVWPDITLATDTLFEDPDCLILKTGQSLELVTDAEATTTEPTFVATWEIIA